MVLEPQRLPVGPQKGLTWTSSYNCLMLLSGAELGTGPDGLLMSTVGARWGRGDTFQVFAIPARTHLEPHSRGNDGNGPVGRSGGGTDRKPRHFP